MTTAAMPSACRRAAKISASMGRRNRVQITRGSEVMAPHSSVWRDLSKYRPPIRPTSSHTWSGGRMNRIVSREEWVAERKRLLLEEKEFTRRRDALAETRRALPWVKVDKDYEFDSAQGRVKFA